MLPPAPEKKETGVIGPFRPVSDIPGPKGWPIMGDLRQFNQIGGSGKFNVYAEKLHKDYGPIVR
jgi:hypothetical protein